MSVIIPSSRFGFGIAKPNRVVQDPYTVALTSGGSAAVSLVYPSSGGDPQVNVAFTNGPRLENVGGFGQAAQIAATTPWALLAKGIADNKLRVTADGATGVLGFQFTGSGSTITVSPAVGPVASFVLSDPATVDQWISVTTQATAYIAGGLTITFRNLASVADFAMKTVPDVLGWIAAVGGVTWQVV